MHYKLGDPARTSYRHPFYGYGDEVTGIPAQATTIPVASVDPVGQVKSVAIPAATVALETTSKKTGFSVLGPLVAFGTSFLASYVVARHIQIDKPKAMNLAVTMGLLSGIGQAAAQVMQGWIEKAQDQIETGTADKLLSTSASTTQKTV